MKLKGIDVSYCQPNMNWEKAKREGVQFAILRCGYGSDYTYQDDNTFSYNVAQCEKYGIPYGLYLYSYAKTVAQAESEGRHALRLAKTCGKNFKLGIWYDMEEESQRQLGSVCKTFLDTFINTIGKQSYPVGVYSNLAWLNTSLRGIDPDKYPVWLAQWNDVPQWHPDKIYGWQWGLNKNLSQFPTGVDGDYWYHELDVVEPTPITPAKKKSITTLAKEVIDGKWGVGKDRKERLTKAGYDYEKVQAKVNELLSANRSYKVKVTARSGLNCRAGAGTNYPVKFAYGYNKELTISDEKNGWGKTPDGWVSLQYTKKV